MLSVSGLTTFAITASSGIPCSSVGSYHRWVVSALSAAANYVPVAHEPLYCPRAM